MAREAEAEEHRRDGNVHFKAQRFEEAIGCYRQALQILQQSLEVAADADGWVSLTPLGQAVRLNLAACLLRTSADPAEAILLCSDVLSSDVSCAKALFRRGTAQQELARRSADAAASREALLAARSDFRKAASLEPTDRQVRAHLEAVTTELRAAGSGSGSGLRLGFGGGLYDDLKPAEPPPPPVVCTACGREGHPMCGRAFWVQQRAEWLCVPAEVVGRDPVSFERSGRLRAALRAARAESAGGPGALSGPEPLAASAPRAPGSAVEDAAAAADGRSDGEDDLSDFSDELLLEDLSESEQEVLEDCLGAVDRPFPALRRKLALPHAVQTANLLWSET